METRGCPASSQSRVQLPMSLLFSPSPPLSCPVSVGREMSTSFRGRLRAGMFHLLGTGVRYHQPAGPECPLGAWGCSDTVSGRAQAVSTDLLCSLVHLLGEVLFCKHYKGHSLMIHYSDFSLFCVLQKIRYSSVSHLNSLQEAIICNVFQVCSCKSAILW